MKLYDFSHTIRTMQRRSKIANPQNVEHRILWYEISAICEIGS